MTTKRVLFSFGLEYAKYATTTTSTRFFKIWSPLYRPLVPFKLSDIGEGIREVTVKRSFIKPNQRVNQFEDVLEVESDKAAVTITSRFDGEVKNIYFEEGDVINVGAVLCDIHVEDDEDEKSQLQVPQDVGRTEDEIADEEIFCFNNKPLATPAVRRLARENNIQLSSIKGTGKAGRVLKEDILLHLSRPTNEQRGQNFKETKEFIQPLTNYQKVMIRTMTESNLIPALGLSDEIDVTELEILRQTLKSSVQNDVKITLLAFIVKAISLALEKYPMLNSTFQIDGVNLLSSHNIGIAVDTSAGLVVPNIKDVQTLSVRRIAREIQRLQTLSSENKLSLTDTSNGTFTISNIGAIAGTIVKPLILPPQVAIVGIGRVQRLPRFDVHDQLCKRSLVNVSWAADHRIIDGATVARFSNLVRSYLENPGFLALDA